MNHTRPDDKKLKALRNWKLMDVWGQICTVILPCLWYVFLSGHMEDREFIMFQSMVIANIGWVAISLIAHIWVWRAPWIVLGRKILAIIYLLILIGEVPYLVFVAPHNTGGRSGPETHVLVMLGLMACVPLMGIPYFFISIHELQRLKSGKYIREYSDRPQS